ncbi:uncharacterized protein DS421_16g542590 [Arachis hypogaea]|nr:uncharacterized protein DS421_16g542590 [Arachis hypogaea]
MSVRSAQRNCQTMKRRSKASLKSIFTPTRRSAIVLLEVGLREKVATAPNAPFATIPQPAHLILLLLALTARYPSLVVVNSVDEICSAYPTSGGLYYWSAKLAGPTWAPFASWITGWFNIIGQVIVLLSTGEKMEVDMKHLNMASVKFVFTHFNTDNGVGISSSPYIFLVGLLMAQYSLSEYDASAHMLNFQTEETKEADKNGPKGIISAVGISIILRLCYILGITFAVTNIPYLLSKDNDAGGYAIAQIFYVAFKDRYGHSIGGIICLIIVVVAIFFCGMSSVTSNSRLL